MTDRHPILGTIGPDPIGRILGTGYSRFYSKAGVRGLAKTTDTRLDLLAIESQQIGTGQFSRFMAQAKAHYQEIYVWFVDSTVLQAILLLYGFTPCDQVELDGSKLSGFVWKQET